jgi:hypothetical protein
MFEITKIQFAFFLQQFEVSVRVNVVTSTVSLASSVRRLMALSVRQCLWLIYISSVEQLFKSGFLL